MKLATRLAIAMILLVAVAVSAVGWLSHYSLERAFLPRVLDRIETQSGLLASQLEAQTKGARADIATFQTRAAVTQDYDELIKSWKAEVPHKKT